MSRDAADRRVRNGVDTTLQVLGQWLVPLQDKAIVAVPARPLWWTSAASMVPEMDGARAAARTYFGRFIDTTGLPPAFAGALVEYAARRGVSKIFDREYFSVNRGRLEGRYFGGFVPRDLRVPLPVEGDGDRALLTLDTLDRFVGRPVFDAILLEFLTSSRGTRPSLDDFVAVASRVGGQDLSWLFDEALKTPRQFDYAITAFDSRQDTDGRFRTTVTVRRLGDGVFRRGVPVVTTFAGGDSVTETFDGRNEQATYEYRSQGPARTASVDPDAFLLLDRNRGNNGMSLDTQSARTAANRWTARWLIWLEDALLTYVALT
ncbi:MAG TPA: hypothetical protein VN628_07725 [Vicinamibacterales bacterium]|nr:hypothetical protein [Vicinamibacterales bacterium]